MNKQKWTLLALVLLMIAGTGLLLTRLRANQRLGAPGVKTSPLPGSHNLQVDLPVRVLDYESTNLPVEKMVLDTLPKDTSFGQRLYTAPDKSWVQVNVVLMGSDRTSIHKPQICLGGMGFKIDEAASGETSVHLERPFPYELPVMKLIASKEVTEGGRKYPVRGIYVYWFVAENQYTSKHNQRMWWMAKEMLRTGVLQRWAYISYFAICPPGGEEATFERLKTMIAASVPEFQLTPRPGAVAISARQ